MNQPAVSGVGAAVGAPSAGAGGAALGSASRGWLVGAFILWGLTLLRPTFSNGDAAAYAHAALKGEIAPYQLHTAYLLVARGWLALTQGLVPSLVDSWPGAKMLHGVLPPALSSALSLNLLSLVWGVVAVIGLLRLERRFLPGRLVGIAALCWLGMPGVLHALTTAEVEAMTWALCIWSLVLWLDGRVWVGPMVWGMALMVTPAAVAMAPAFPLRPEPPKRQLLILFGLPVLMWGVLALISGPDILYGARGLLSSPPRVPLKEMLELRMGQLPAALGAVQLFLLVGLLAAFRGEWLEGGRLLRALVFTTMQTFLMTDRYRDIPAYGFVGVLVALVAAQGWHLTRERVSGRQGSGFFFGLVGGALLLQCVLADQQVRKLRREEQQLACKSVALADASRMDDAFRVYGPFREQRLFMWYTGRVIGDGATPSTGKLGSDGLPDEEGWYLGMPGVLPFRSGWQLVPIWLEDPDAPMAVWRWRRTAEPDPLMSD